MRDDSEDMVQILNRTCLNWNTLKMEAGDYFQALRNIIKTQMFNSWGDGK